MPIYDFFCEECDATEEIIHGMDAPPPLCEKHGTPMKKLLTKIHVRMGAGLFSVDSPSVKRLGED